MCTFFNLDSSNRIQFEGLNVFQKVKVKYGRDKKTIKKDFL